MQQTNTSFVSTIKDFIPTKQFPLEIAITPYCELSIVKRVIDNTYYRMYKYPLQDYIGDALKNNFIPILINKLNKLVTSSRNNNKYNENIIEYKDAFLDNVSNCLYIITEFAYETVNTKYIKKAIATQKNITEDKILECIKQICNGLSQMHRNKIFNFNLSPKNILISPKGNLKIDPFSYFFSDQNRSNNNLSDVVVPELGKGKIYFEKSDIWYLGLFIYEMCCLKEMKRAFIEDIDAMYGEIIKSNYSPIPSTYSKELKNLIKMCLQFTGERRPSPKEIIDYVTNIQTKRKVTKRINLYKLKKGLEKGEIYSNVKQANLALMANQNYNSKISNVNKLRNNSVNIIKRQKSAGLFQKKKNHEECVKEKEKIKLEVQQSAILTFSHQNKQQRALTPIPKNSDVVYLNTHAQLGNLEANGIITKLKNIENYKKPTFDYEPKELNGKPKTDYFATENNLYDINKVKTRKSFELEKKKLFPNRTFTPNKRYNYKTNSIKQKDN